MHRQKKKWLIALMLCVSLLTTSAMPLPAYATLTTPEDGAEEALNEDDIQSDDDANRELLANLQDKSDKLASERKKIESSINDAKNQKEQQQAIKNTLDGKLNNTLAQIGVLEERVVVLKENIQLTEDRIAELQENIAANYKLFLERVRASYMSGDIQPMSVVLGADNYYDSLVAAKTIESIADHDNALIESLHNDKAEVEEALSNLELDKKDLETSIEKLEEEKITFQEDIAATKDRIEDIAKMEQEFRANLAANQAESKRLQAEMNEVFARIQSTGEYVGGEMLWPVPGFSTISSYYGWRWNNTDYHTGIDITGSGVLGHTIVAANSGTVAVVNTGFVPGKGYGKYVIVDHGGGTVTLYGHCDSILVSEGQSVAKGTPIAKVGSTGWSTGPHLHFEVRVNDKHTNPLAYLKG